MNTFLSRLTAEFINPMYPSRPLERPRDDASLGGANSVAVWTEWLYSQKTNRGHQYTCLLHLEPALLIGAYRSVFGDLPRTNADGEYILNEGEMQYLCSCLWPEARTQDYRRRCQAGKHLEKLRAVASK